MSSPNSAAGTMNGGNVVAPSGNSFLDGLAAITNVLVQGANGVSSFLDAKSARKLENAQAASPANAAASWDIGFIGNTDKLQQVLLLVAGACFVGAGAYYVVKKLK